MIGNCPSRKTKGDSTILIMIYQSQTDDNCEMYLDPLRESCINRGIPTGHQLFDDATALDVVYWTLRKSAVDIPVLCKLYLAFIPMASKPHR